jgi:ribosome recycling factor
MVKVWKIEEIPTTKMINNDVVNLTDDERQKVLKDWNECEQEVSDNRIVEIREIRNKKLSETDYLAMSDNTMSDEMKAFRKKMRDIPQDYSEDKYDELLARDSDGKLTHTVWEKP